MDALGYNLVDGHLGASAKQLQVGTVWCTSTGTITQGQVLILHVGGTVPTGYDKVWKLSDANETGDRGVMVAQTTVVPSGGGLVPVIRGGHVVASAWGLTSSAAITAGARVASSATSGTIKEGSDTYDSANCTFGLCVVAFSGATSDGEVLWDDIQT